MRLLPGLVLLLLAIPAAHADVANLTLTVNGYPPSVFSLNSLDGAEVLTNDTFQVNAYGISELEFPYSDYVNASHFPDVIVDLTAGSQIDYYGSAVISGSNSDFIPGLDTLTDVNGKVVGTLNVQIAATPEPSSLLLLGTGVLGLAGATRRLIRSYP